MHLKGWAITLGVGAAAGAVAVMMPKSNPARRLAAKTAVKVEDAMWKAGDKLSNTLDF